MSMALAGRERGAPSTSVSTRMRSLKRGETRSAHAISSCRKTWCVQKATDEGLLVPQHHLTRGTQEHYSVQHAQIDHLCDSKLQMNSRVGCRIYMSMLNTLHLPVLTSGSNCQVVYVRCC